jgi:hypothetical protein
MLGSELSKLKLKKKLGLLDLTLPLVLKFNWAFEIGPAFSLLRNNGARIYA